jgi:hypothetical protein
VVRILVARELRNTRETGSALLDPTTSTSPVAPGDVGHRLFRGAPLSICADSGCEALADIGARLGGHLAIGDTAEANAIRGFASQKLASQ